MRDKAEQAKGHLEAFLRIVVIPIPALAVLVWAIVTSGTAEAGKLITIFGLELPIRIVSLVVGVLVIVLLLASARSLFALAFLLPDDAQTDSAAEVIERHTSPLNPFFATRTANLLANAFINNFGSVALGFLLGMAIFTDIIMHTVPADGVMQIVYFSKLAAAVLLFVSFRMIARKLKRQLSIGFAMPGGILIALLINLALK